MCARHSHPWVTSPVPREVWASLLRSDEDAVVGQSLAWRDSVFASGRYQDVSLLYAFPSGRRVVLPLARPRWQPPKAAVVASWPRVWSVGGPISDAGRIAPDEAAAVLADVARRGTLGASMTLRHNADENWLRQAHQFQIRRYGRFIVDLGGGFDQVWRHKVQKRVRRAVRQAESSLDVEVGRSGQLLGTFEDLHKRSITARADRDHEPIWLARLRMAKVSPASPRQLGAVAEHFGQDCSVWVARAHGQPVAAHIVLRYGAYAKAWRGALDRTLAGSENASKLLHRLAMEEACQQGCRFYDLTGAEPGSPLAAFKERLGATMYFTYELSTERLPLRSVRAPRRWAVAVFLERASQR